VAHCSCYSITRWPIGVRFHDQSVCQARRYRGAAPICIPRRFLVWVAHVAAAHQRPFFGRATTEGATLHKALIVSSVKPVGSALLRWFSNSCAATLHGILVFRCQSYPIRILLIWSCVLKVSCDRIPVSLCDDTCCRKGMQHRALRHQGWFKAQIFPLATGLVLFLHFIPPGRRLHFFLGPQGKETWHGALIFCCCIYLSQPTFVLSCEKYSTTIWIWIAAFGTARCLRCRCLSGNILLSQ